MKNELSEARKILEEREALLLRYPDRCSLKISVKMWRDIVANLEKENTKNDLC